MNMPLARWLTDCQSYVECNFDVLEVGVDWIVLDFDAKSISRSPQRSRRKE